MARMGTDKTKAWHSAFIRAICVIRGRFEIGRLPLRALCGLRVYAALLMLLNLTSDIVAAWMNPKVRLEA